MVTSSARDEAMPAPRDLGLVREAAQGNAHAYHRLVEPRLAVLYRTARAILRNDADAADALQEACVRAWTRLPRLREPDRFDAWLGQILLNTCRDSLRSRRQTSVREIDLADGDAHADARQASVDDRLATVDAIRRAFLRLSPDARVVLALHHGQQRPIAEIAELLGVPAGTVKWRLHEARKALARALERER